MKPQVESSSALSRRDFFKASAGLALGASSLVSPRTLSAAERRRSIGANDRIRIGIIGCGNRGRSAHMQGIYRHLAETNFEIVALCDPWRVAREEANAMVREWFGREARQYVSHRDLLATDGIDAVMIASPDHHHTVHLEAAARAGKHIYVEKPLADDMEKLKRAVDAVMAADLVVQVGTQLRSLPGIVGARELFQSGLLGKLSLAEECRNYERPFWYRYIREVRREDVDWGEFLGDRPMRPFNPVVYSAWYGYLDFSQGAVSQYGSHFLDTVHSITGAEFPESCVCAGGTFTWKDDQHRFTAPDCVQATWIYPEGFMLTTTNNLGNSFGSTRKLFTDKGVLKIDNWSIPLYSAQGGPRRDGSIRGEREVEPVHRPDHYLDWLQCMRGGRMPYAPIEAGYQHAVACLMAVRSYETGRKTVYDRENRVIRTA